MERAKRWLRRLFCLPPVLTVLVAVPSFAFVIVVLWRGESGAASYAAYLLSAYSLIIVSTGVYDIVTLYRRNGVESLPVIRQMRGNPYGQRLLGDEVFRSEVTLHGGLAANLLYAALNLYAGVRERSAWFIALAVYYLLLSAMRGLLVRFVHRTPLGTDLAAEYRASRICGVLLLGMNHALAGIVAYMVWQNRGFSYAGLTIYAMAAYTFYITIVAMVQLVRYRRRGSPILSAAKVISLTAALVSMLSLETAMIAQFGGEQHTFRRIMTSVSGGAVCITVLAMAVYMIFRANRKLREFHDSETKR